jgi:hypothetical protein
VVDFRTRGIVKIFRQMLPFIIITVLCIAGVELFYRQAERSLFKSVAISPKTAAPLPAVEETREKIDTANRYQRIVHRDLFGTGSSGPEGGRGAGDPLAGLPLTAVDLLLLGTITGDPDDKRAIIMDKEQHTQDIYHIGDSVQGGVIKDIVWGRVVLGFRDRDEILDMTEARQYFSEPAAITPSRNQGKALPTAEALPAARPAETDIKIVPPLRKFSLKTGNPENKK